ncbi:MAG: hypothetical protein LBE70_02625 [Nitrososphaerota archaeon]|jgi:hypothetical protein|nr:hypothetical protein [Nitrososphaerota archaeon]
MPNLDVAMPLALLFIVTAAVFLNKRTEKKFQDSVEENEFKTKDILMVIAVLVIGILTFITSSVIHPGRWFENAVLSFFLGTYTMLLFSVTYIFSGIRVKRAQLFSICFGFASLLTGAICFLEPLRDSATAFRVGAFFGLSVLCFVIAFYEHRKPGSKKAKWYLAIQPPALFLLFFVFFNLYFEGTLNAQLTGAYTVWFPGLLNVFGATFAIMIILYLSPLFSWKFVGIFAFMLTLIDIILVFSGPMGAAAETFTGLGLPVLIYLPNVPLITTDAGAFLLRGLGLGDFFFAGILAIQIFNKFGKKYAYVSVVSMVLSFGIWEAFLPDITTFFNINGFPATVCIITGWIPIVVIGTLLHKKLKKTSSLTPLQTEHVIEVL